MIEAIVSGQAASYAVLTSRTSIIHRLDGSSVELSNGDLSRVFHGCTDLKRIKVKSVLDAHNICSEHTKLDRSLRFFLAFLEEADDDICNELAAILEDLLEAKSVRNFILEAMYVDALPGDADLLRLAEKYSVHQGLAEILRDIVKHQPLIARVRNSLDSADISELISNDCVAKFRATVFQSGIQREIVSLLDEGKSVDFAVMRFTSSCRALRGAARAINSWTKEIRKEKTSLPSFEGYADEDFEEAERSNPSTRGRGVFERIRSQQAGIEQKLRTRDVISAEKFADDMIRQQRSDSTSAQIAKSLSQVSQLAKKHNIPDLQLKWALEAVRENPNDFITHSHVIDAFIGQNRLHEASNAVEELESIEGGFFALFSKARLFRVRGDFEQARAAYLKLVADHPHHAETPRARAGAAEILRDMNRSDEALSEYIQLTRDYPTEEAYWCGLASVYMDMGAFDKAIQNFGKATRKSNVVAMNGRATAYRHAGKFEQALRLYEQALAESPNDPISLCGRAEVYKAKGDYVNARASFEEAIERNPYVSTGFIGLFEVLKETGQIERAQTLLTDVSQRFPDDPSVAGFTAELLAERKDWQNALNAYEVVIRNYPRALNSLYSKAQILRKLNRLGEALAVYDTILANQPYSKNAQLGKAATLIQMKQFSEAERLLNPPNHPKTFYDWKTYLLLALLNQARSDYRKSRSMLELGARSTPFAKMRRIYSAALSKQSLTGGRASDAVRQIASEQHELSNVIRLHALAAAGRSNLATSAWKEISESDPHREIAIEIARRYRIVDEAPRYDLGWIYSSEDSAMLLEAA